MAVIFDRGSFSWLVFDVVEQQPAILGGSLFICGRASVDVEADLIVVATPTGQRKVAQIARAEMCGLARRLLREMHMTKAAGQ